MFLVYNIVHSQNKIEPFGPCTIVHSTIYTVHLWITEFFVEQIEKHADDELFCFFSEVSQVMSKENFNVFKMDQKKTKCVHLLKK